MSHDLAEQTTGLASRVNNLAVITMGPECQSLLELQDRLAKQVMVAIVKDLNEERADYQAAIKGLNDAIALIGEGNKRIENVAKVIKMATKAADLVDKVIKAV